MCVCVFVRVACVCLSIRSFPITQRVTPLFALVFNSHLEGGKVSHHACRLFVDNDTETKIENWPTHGPFVDERKLWNRVTQLPQDATLKQMFDHYNEPVRDIMIYSNLNEMVGGVRGKKDGLTPNARHRQYRRKVSLMFEPPPTYVHACVLYVLFSTYTHTHTYDYLSMCLRTGPTTLLDTAGDESEYVPIFLLFCLSCMVVISLSLMCIDCSCMMCRDIGSQDSARSGSPSEYKTNSDYEDDYYSSPEYNPYDQEEGDEESDWHEDPDECIKCFDVLSKGDVLVCASCVATAKERKKKVIDKIVIDLCENEKNETEKKEKKLVKVVKKNTE